MNVYWSALPLHEEVCPVITYQDPIRSLDVFNSIDMSILPLGANFRYCPAFRGKHKNQFRLRFPFGYNLQFKDDHVMSDMHDQLFFDEMVSIRSPQLKMYSFNLAYIFIAEEDLEMMTGGCEFSDNDFVNKTMITTGQYNIGKWARPLECAFMLKKDVSELKINRGDEYLTVNFLTDEKVNLVKFHTSDKLAAIIKANVSTRNYLPKGFGSLQYYYDLYQQSRIKKVIMKEIKSNLM